jgi:hypothetical protein
MRGKRAIKKAGVDMTASAPFDKTIAAMNSIMDEIEKILADKEKGKSRSEVKTPSEAKGKKLEVEQVFSVTLTPSRGAAGKIHIRVPL